MRQLTFQRVIGSGAFGTVYLAELAGLRGFRRTVAVKVLLSGQADSEMFVSRVRDEARLLGLLHDEHILKVLELVRVGDRDAVVMEYVEGVDLGALVAGGAPPPPRALAELGAAVAGALHAAHTAVHPSSGESLNVVHRDVKPANVMVTAGGGVKLLDFGVAQARFAARESRTGQFVLGTLNYMAPEYVITGEVSPAADVYGLALTLWEAAVGAVFGQPKLKQESHARRVEERLGRLAATHAELAALMAPMLAWDPAGRPSASEVELQLVAAADRLAGTGVRSWAATHVPTVMASQQQSAKDSVGLAGQSVPVADEVAAAPEAAPPAAAPPRAPEDYTLLNVQRPAFLDQPTPPPPAPPVSRSVTPASRPPPRPSAAGPAPTASAPPRPASPRASASGPRATPGRRPGRNGGSPLVTVIIQGLLVGGLVGILLVVVLGLYLFAHRSGG
jgi:serine/threonine protein kinase